MGTRMVSCAESPVHNNWKQAIIRGKETDTVFLNEQSRPALRALRTQRTAALQPLGKFNAMEHMSRIQDLYFGGDMEAAIPLTGEVCGRIDAVLTAEQIISQTIEEFQQLVQDLARRYS